MSGFSPHWLRLREPADHAGRSGELLARLGRHFAASQSVHVLDLGCGAGSNLRGTFQALPGRQLWTLVDHDERLLEAAKAELLDWAEEAEVASSALVLRKGGKRIEVRFRQVDLSRGIEELLPVAPDLVAASALFDLVSRDWLMRFAETLAARALPLYTVMTYDGEQDWAPVHAHDAAVHNAFLRHQHGDKGFGPAAGPEAVAILSDALSSHGFQVRTAASPWSLDAGSVDLVRELAEGIAAAAGEAGDVAPADLEAWRKARLAAASDGAAFCRVGHLDLLAAPGSALLR